MIPELRAAGAAFLVAVLVCDLTFDLPVWRSPPGDSIALERALDAMTRYYRRVTARRSPLSTSVTLVMTGMLASLAYELLSMTKTELPRFAAESLLAVGPIVFAATRTFPRARRLATGEGDAAGRIELARTIARDHVTVLPAMLLYAVLQIARV